MVERRNAAAAVAAILDELDMGAVDLRVRCEESTVRKISPFDKPLEHSTGLKCAEMTRIQKYVFAAKRVACIATFGYAFPNVQNS